MVQCLASERFQYFLLFYIHRDIVFQLPHRYSLCDKLISKFLIRGAECSCLSLKDITLRAFLMLSIGV